jgi:hypothetical protein
VPKEVFWKSGHPATGDCVFVEIKNSTNTTSYFGTAACSEKKRFVCETRATAGTKADSWNSECMALWDVSPGEILATQIIQKTYKFIP